MLNLWKTNIFLRLIVPPPLQLQYLEDGTKTFWLPGTLLLDLLLRRGWVSHGSWEQRKKPSGNISPRQFGNSLLLVLHMLAYQRHALDRDFFNLRKFLSYFFMHANSNVVSQARSTHFSFWGWIAAVLSQEGALI